MNTGKQLRIKRLERLWNDGRPLCEHAFTLIVDGRMVQDDAPCACGGERITLVAAYEDEQPSQSASAESQARAVAAE
ncbi:MAG TPA: hypothetical protein VGV59_01410 [Pyrinomonadaceae bacterium]|nr:hypothetical protein [Pyrinomonadaceae bacterium]